MEWLATNLLELSKLDSGLVQLNLREEDLRAVVESAYQQAEPVAGRKGVTLVLHLPPDPVRQPHDPPRVGQVLTNLIGNAIKFTPRGGEVHVELTATAEGARITVADTGVGIPADELPHVFERFWRGAGTRERGSGSGLGLSIVKRIVDMHEGRVQVVSTPGAGTRFTVLLPRRVSVSSPRPGPA
jgi:signal transduction histidine kinase